MKITRHQIGILFLCILGSSCALASDGYFSTGYGAKSNGIGGVGIAFPQDGFASAFNPAGTALVDDQIDMGMYIIRILLFPIT